MNCLLKAFAMSLGLMCIVVLESYGVVLLWVVVCGLVRV